MSGTFLGPGGYCYAETQASRTLTTDVQYWAANSGTTTSAWFYARDRSTISATATLDVYDATAHQFAFSGNCTLLGDGAWHSCGQGWSFSLTLGDMYEVSVSISTTELITVDVDYVAVGTFQAPRKGQAS